MELVISYLIEKGGIWGVMLAMSIAWIVWREKTSKGVEKSDGVEELKIKDLIDKSESILKEITSLKDKSYEMNDKIVNIINICKDLEKTNIYNRSKIEDLTKEIKYLNEERIDDFKTVMSDYNDTLRDFVVALEKIKLTLEFKLEEE